MKNRLLISILFFGMIFSSYAQSLFDFAPSNDEDSSSIWVIDASFGLPTGDSADFYSFSYSIGFGYYFGISDSSFYAGAEAGYLRFTGKDTDFGFETDGAGFIPIQAKVGYNISESFGLEGGGGYAVSADGGDGDAIYSVGFNWYPVEKLTFSTTFSSVGGDFDEFAIGIRRTF